MVWTVLCVKSTSGSTTQNLATVNQRETVDCVRRLEENITVSITLFVGTVIRTSPPS